MPSAPSHAGSEDRVCRPRTVKRSGSDGGSGLSPTLPSFVSVRCAWSRTRAGPRSDGSALCSSRGNGDAVAGSECRGHLEASFPVAVHQVPGPGAVGGVEVEVLQFEAHQGVGSRHQVVHRLVDGCRVSPRSLPLEARPVLLDPPKGHGAPQGMRHWPYVKAVDAALTARGIPPGTVRASHHGIERGMTTT
jgi:hypothetical protein